MTVPLPILSGRADKRESGRIQMRLPPWFKQELSGEASRQMARLFSESAVHTVCREARCPNSAYCFRNKRATFLLLGDACTRDCGFCGVKKTKNPHPAVDEDEPCRIRDIVERLGLSYAVITSVTRDDLSDGGAAIFARAIELIRRINKDIKVEALIPDFQGKLASLKRVLDAAPFVVAHNIETVSRLYSALRPQADYRLSLSVLSRIKELSGIKTKSSLMLGLGETEREVVEAMEDLRAHKCDCLALGQYLAPTAGHYPVKEFVEPGRFRRYRDIGLALGFSAVFSGPKVRSSYCAEEMQGASVCTI